MKELLSCSFKPIINNNDVSQQSYISENNKTLHSDNSKTVIETVKGVKEQIIRYDKAR